MKVYVVINEALYPFSSYYDIIVVCQNLESAKSVVETSIQDLVKSIDRGENSHFEIGKYRVEYEDMCVILSDEMGYYDRYQIEEHELV
jgi:hypothetical protein